MAIFSLHKPQKNLLFFLFRNRNHIAAHVLTQYFRNHYAAVGLLVIFQNSGYGTAYCQPGSVQCMYELRLESRKLEQEEISR